MQTIRIITKAPLRGWRNISLCSVYNQSMEVQHQSKIDPIAVPSPSNVDKPLSPKIEKLVSEISGLSLLEISELTGGLKKRLNLPDAPVMPVGFSAVPSAAADEEDEAPKTIKTIFTVKLMKFDEKQKVPLIKVIKSLVEGMNLVQAKKFVESAPAVVKADVSKEEAEQLKEAILKAGGTVQID